MIFLGDNTGGWDRGAIAHGWPLRATGTQDLCKYSLKKAASAFVVDSGAFGILASIHFPSFARKTATKIRGGLYGSSLPSTCLEDQAVASIDERTLAALASILAAALDRARAVCLLLPRDSWGWVRPVLQGVSDQYNLVEIVFDQCAHGRGGRFAGRLLTNIDSCFLKLRTCSCSSAHSLCDGRFTAFPPQLMEDLYEGFARWRKERFE